MVIRELIAELQKHPSHLVVVVTRYSDYETIQEVVPIEVVPMAGGDWYLPAQEGDGRTHGAIFLTGEGGRSAA